MALTRGDTGWRVFVTPTSPPRLLGIGGPLLAEVDRLAGTGQPDGRAYPDVELVHHPAEHQVPEPDRHDDHKHRAHDPRPAGAERP